MQKWPLVAVVVFDVNIAALTAEGFTLQQYIAARTGVCRGVCVVVSRCVSRGVASVVACHGLRPQACPSAAAARGGLVTRLPARRVRTRPTELPPHFVFVRACRRPPPPHCAVPTPPLPVLSLTPQPLRRQPSPRSTATATSSTTRQGACRLNSAGPACVLFCAACRALLPTTWPAPNPETLKCVPLTPPAGLKVPGQHVWLHLWPDRGHQPLHQPVGECVAHNA
jgi:hypothetical protein